MPVIDVEVMAERPGRFRIMLDRPLRSIECEMQGLWSREDGSHFCAVLAEKLADLRRRNGHATALFNMSVSRLQLFTAMTLPRSKTMILEGDRVAVVVTSAMLRLAMKQQPVLTRDHAYFETREEAREWLRSARNTE